MAAKAVALSPLPRISSRIPTKSTSPIIILTVHSNASHFPSPLRSSRRISNYTQEGNLIAGPRDWGASGFDVDDDDDDSDEDDDDDRSLDLLVRFFQNMFRKISRRARKAVRSVLPVLISPSLVRFSVNGVLTLACLWVVKAFLEVACSSLKIHPCMHRHGSYSCRRWYAHSGL
ncbi:uncharacterized protein LOC131218850 isoform X2 [Magnolia sinica]|uniref:uncharacterized protein LOC131218850 isoform X2 n=1 Tax=Magnolia sinica TaxID=86752 RepID=UPI00265AC198|nr:uncharacterized protein LOC131218850 isoform X2 [Magnolia sinica]